MDYTVVSPNQLCSKTYCYFGKVGTEATSAELHGDIDGFMMGYWLCTTTNGQAIRKAMVQGNSIKLSMILGEYYRTRTDRPLNMIAGSGYELVAVRRFSNFNVTFSTLKNTFATQTVGFNTLYAPTVAKQSPNPQETLNAVWDFEKWCINGGK